MCPLQQTATDFIRVTLQSMSEHMNVCVCLSVGVCEGYQPEGKAAWWCDRQIRKKE